MSDATQNSGALGIGDPQAGLRTTAGEARRQRIAKNRNSDRLSRVLAATQNSTAPRLAEFIESVVIEMGGPQSCAREWVAEFRATKPGSHQRSRMLSQLAEMMGIYGDMTGEHGAMDEMSNEDLMAVLEHIGIGNEDEDDEGE